MGLCKVAIRWYDGCSNSIHPACQGADGSIGLKQDHLARQSDGSSGLQKLNRLLCQSHDSGSPSAIDDAEPTPSAEESGMVLCSASSKTSALIH